MTYKEQLLQNIERELTLLKRLGTIVEEKDLDFRPHEKMRSTMELMQYLSGLCGVMFRWMLVNDLTPEVRQEIADYRATLTIANFAERLDEQFTIVKKHFDTFSEEDLLTKEVELPWKEKMTLGAAIINAPVKWLATYRMELFMYLKMNGHADLSTKEAWVPLEEPKLA